MLCTKHFTWTNTNNIRKLTSGLSLGLPLLLHTQNLTKGQKNVFSEYVKHQSTVTAIQKSVHV